MKLILQFLKENNLHDSASALQEETDVSLNLVSNKAKLKEDIEAGRM